MGDLAEKAAMPPDVTADKDDAAQETEAAGRASRFRMRPWPYFGGLALLCFGLQVVTGIVMVFSYEAGADRAYASVYSISNVMPYGWLVRTIHHWGAHLTIAFAGLHAVRAFLVASYKPRRQLNWVLGAVALLAALALAFTGSLLPWDQKAFWDTSAAVSLLKQLPLIGGWIASVVLGGDTLGATTLTRFFWAHVAVLPIALLGLLVGHFWLASKREEDEDETVPFYPDIIIPAATAVVLVLSVYAVLAIILAVSLDVRADPSAVAAAEPAWYFMSLSTLLRYLSPALAATVTILLGVLFILLPYVDHGPSRAPKDRILALAIGFFVIGGVLALTAVGAFL